VFKGIEQLIMETELSKVAAAYAAALQREEDLKKVLGKKALELMEAAAQLKIVSAENTKEQELTYRLAAQLQTERESRTNDVRMLRLRNVKDQAMHLRNELHRRKTECEKIINHLNLFSDDISEVTVATCVSKLKDHSNKLTQGLDCLQEVYQSRIQQVVNSDTDLTQRIDLDIEMDLGDPELSPQESEALRLLAIIGLSSSTKISSNWKNSVSNSSNESKDSRRDLEDSISWSPAENKLSRLENKIVGSSIQRTVQTPFDSRNGLENPRLSSLYVEKGLVKSSLLDDKAVGSSIQLSVRTQLKRNSFVPGSQRQGSREDGLDKCLLQGSSNHCNDQPESESRLSNTERLINKLQLSFPSLSLEDLRKYIMNIRQLNNGKISGLTVETIKKMVSEMLAWKGKVETLDLGSLDIEHNDSDCTICYETMTESNSRLLDPCKHRFHTKCINDWMGSSLGAGNTCPICRDYIVQEDEFPVLS